MSRINRQIDSRININQSVSRQKFTTKRDKREKNSIKSVVSINNRLFDVKLLFGSQLFEQ